MKQVRRKRTRIRKGRVAAAVFSLVFAGAMAVPLAYDATGRVLPGTLYDGESVSGESPEDIEEKIAKSAASHGTGKLVLTLDTEKVEWDKKDFHVGVNKEAEKDRVLEAGREGGIFYRIGAFWSSCLHGQKVEPHFTYDKDAVKEKVKELGKTYAKPAQMPQPLIHEDSSVTFTPGRPFMKIKAEELEKAVGKALSLGKDGEITIPVSDSSFPKLTEDEEKKINHVLAKYTTEFYPDPNRSRNIELAAQAISGHVVRPGESFSFNQTTGERTHEKGYVDAPVFVDGKLVPDAGGGVCQVSTTLFNAVLLSGLKVTNRANHFGPVNYAPLGRDATVSYGSIDFSFTNNLKNPVYIFTVYEAGRISVYILGNSSEVPSKVSIEEKDKKDVPHKKQIKNDPSLTEDYTVDEGRDGKKITIIQNVTWPDGHTYKDDFYSYYEPVDTIVTYKNADDAKSAKEEYEKEEAAVGNSN